MSRNVAAQIEADAEYARRLQEEEHRNVSFMLGLPDRRRTPYFLSGGPEHPQRGNQPSAAAAAAAAAAVARNNQHRGGSASGGGGVPDRARAPYAYTPGSGGGGGDEAPEPRPHPQHNGHQQQQQQTFSGFGGPHFTFGVGGEDPFEHFHMMFPGFPRPMHPSRRTRRTTNFMGMETGNGNGGGGVGDAMAEMSRLMGDFPSFFNEGTAFGQAFAAHAAHANAAAGGGGGNGGGTSFFAAGGELPAFFRNILETHPNTYEEFLDMIERRGNVNRGASEEEINGLPTEKYTATPRNPGASSAAGRAAGTEDKESCVVCLAEYEEGEEVRKLPCGHIFHTECIDRWLKVNRTCPSCKRSIRSSDTQEGQ